MQVCVCACVRASSNEISTQHRVFEPVKARINKAQGLAHSQLSPHLSFSLPAFSLAFHSLSLSIVSHD